MDSFPLPYSVDVALSTRSHERIGGRRTDAAWLAEQWADPATRVLVLAGGRFPLSEDGTAVRWMSPADAPEGERLLLGERDGVVHFAVLARGFRAPDDWGMLRTVGPLLPASDAGLVVQAQALAEWHRSHRFCARCGGGLVVSGGGYVLRCESCNRHHFPRTDPAVIMLVTDGERALLGRQPTWPEGRFSTLAGFVDPGESLEQAVAREVAEETAVRVDRIVYYASQPWPFPQSLMLGFFAHAVTTEVAADEVEIADARWFTREELSTAARDGSVLLPPDISIARRLIEAWNAGPVGDDVRRW